MKKRIKVIWTTLLPSPYRVDFFNELGKECDLTVVFLKKSSKDRDFSWFKNSFNSFNGVFLSAKTKHQNQTISRRRLFKSFYDSTVDIRIISNIDNLTNIALMLHLKKRKIPFYIEADGAFPKSGSGLKEKLKTILIHSAEGCFSPGIMCDSYFNRYKAKKVFRYPFTSVKKSDIVEKPISTAEKELLRSERNICYKKVIISVGQFIPRKGFDILLEAINLIQNNDIGVYIIGGDAPKNYLDYVEQHSLKNVHFINFLNKKELFQYYKLSDLFVLTTREDIWGLVLNEAISCGLPIISSNKCGAAFELIKNNGMIIDIGDLNGICQSILKFLANDNNISCSNNSLAIARENTLEKMVEKHIQIFEGILQNE